MRRLAEKNSGIVSIPLLGAKGSLNVSVAFGILMQAWSAAIIQDF
jgi:TrmH family RNA methyltransferase